MWWLAHNILVLLHLMVALLDLRELDCVVIIDTFIIVLIATVMRRVRCSCMICIASTHSLSTVLARRLLLKTWQRVARGLKHGTIHVRRSLTAMHIAHVHVLRCVSIVDLTPGQAADVA